MNEITPSDIEAKLLEISKELNTIPGVMSLAKKASPSIAALVGIWLKKVTKKESSNKHGALIEIQLFPKVRKYLFKPSAKAILKMGKQIADSQEKSSD